MQKQTNKKKKKPSLSRMEHAHDTALIVFRVKPKTWKSKLSITSINIFGIKSLDKLTFQEINKILFSPEAAIGEVTFSWPRVIKKLTNRHSTVTLFWVAVKIFN